MSIVITCTKCLVLIQFGIHRSSALCLVLLSFFQENLPTEFPPSITGEELSPLSDMTENGPPQSGPPQITRPVIPSENKTRIPRPMLCRVTLLNGEEFEVSIDVSFCLCSTRLFLIDEANM